MENEDTMTLLDTVITLQMSVENLERLQVTPFNKQKVKMLIKQLIKELDPIVQTNYNKMFGIDQERTLSIINEYERHIKYLAPLNTPDKIAQGQFEEAWARDRKTTEATIHRIITKP
jgi:hypothetical protein